ncbi:A24 family peptidase [Wenxinia saemankumensis]|uniref:Prepilin peptidase CpaA n=1 Tax=Wenxinia saemankumensis TaxID=1447782 RepID=A0A1M6GUF0_9RHOB|nr:prepilin peptidase [Wenxinia saemankumensis]SHJ13573.1 prepilin peptidase CpaA [Wenxinia saemankumensis]
MDTPALAAQALLIVALPVSLWVAWSDLSRMKIPNRAVLALLAGFLLVGPFVLPLPDYGWRWLHFAVMLLAGMAANAIRLMGAGDAKFIAAAAPYVALGDVGPLIWILATASALGYALHLIARVTVGPRLAPGWVSWTSGRRFPMGLPLAMTLVAYLALAATG